MSDFPLPILSFFDKEFNFPLELGLTGAPSATFFKEFFLISKGFLSRTFAASSSTALTNASSIDIRHTERLAYKTSSSFLYYFVMLFISSITVR